MYRLYVTSLKDIGFFGQLYIYLDSNYNRRGGNWDAIRSLIRFQFTQFLDLL